MQHESLQRGGTVTVAHDVNNIDTTTINKKTLKYIYSIDMTIILIIEAAQV